MNGYATNLEARPRMGAYNQLWQIEKSFRLDALLAACPQVLAHGFVADTMRTLIGLLAATGIRIGEALRLTPVDINPGHRSC